MAITRVFCRLRLLVNNEFSLVSKSVVNKNVVLLNKSVQFHALRKFRTQYTIGNALDKCKNETNQGFSSSSSSSDSDSDDDDILWQKEVAGSQELDDDIDSDKYWRKIIILIAMFLLSFA